MKSTGVVRRIDELGRLVIPKEIRKNFKIREGDSIEFFIEGNRIMLEKYSLVNGMLDDITKICISMVEAIENTVLYVYEDSVVSGAGKKYEEYKDQAVSRQMKQLTSERMAQNFKENTITASGTQNYAGYVCPVIVNSDLFGTFVVVGEHRAIVDQDIMLVTTISKIVTRQQEV